MVLGGKKVNKHIILLLVILLFLSSTLFGVTNSSQNLTLESGNLEQTTIDSDSGVKDSLLPMYYYNDNPVNIEGIQTDDWVHQEGWPLKFEINSTHYSMIYDTVVYDLEGDDNLDVVVTYSFSETESYVDAYELDGTRKTDLGFPIFLPGYIMSGVSIGDLDYDGDVEIVVSALIFDNGIGNASLYVFEFNGEKFIESWHFMENTQSAVSLFTPVLGDIDGDGDLEIMLENSRKYYGEWWENVIYAWHHNGSMVSGWPVINNNKFGNHYIPALGDIDNDGRQDVIAGSRDHYVYAWNGDGSLVSGNWPVDIGDIAMAASQVGDLDGDGDLEVVQIGNNNGSIFILDGQGNIIQTFEPFPDKDGIGKTPALGDIDGDGDLEVYANIGYYIYGWHHNGTRINGWPVEAGKLQLVRLSIILGDVDNDNQPDVLLMPSTPRYCIFAFNANGSLIDGWPYLISDGNNIYSSPLLVDLDGDDDVEVVFTYAYLVWPGSPGSFFKIDILNLDGSYNFSTMHWPMFQHDPRHTGIYGFGPGELKTYAFSPYYGLVNNPVSFSSSAIGGYPPYSWHWDFGDGSISDEQNPAYIYTDVGNFSVKVTVTDNTGNTSSDTTWVWIQDGNSPPDKPTINGPVNGITETVYDYLFFTSDPEGNPIWYYVDWDDNSSIDWLGPYSSGEQIIKNHSWTDRGTYIIRCKAKDPYGDESPWGELKVTIPRDKVRANTIYFSKLGRFPLLERLLFH